MNKDNVKRKLAAILHADVVGYSRLMSKDEVGTHQSLVSSLDAMTKTVERHGGAVVNLAGDALLAEFASAVKAIECAVEIQRNMEVRNGEESKGQKLSFRIGLNLGDVIVTRNDIHGDGVNVAARLQALAKPGGICISGSVLDQVKSKLGLGYEYLGEQKVKNIAEPVRAYHVIPEPEVAGMVRGERWGKWLTWRWAAVFAIVAVLGAGAVSIWSGLVRLSPTGFEATSESTGGPQIPAKPSIAVLPFRNLGNDRAQDYFSDGITEDIITDLSKFHGLFVIASNTVFTYKGKPVDVRAVGRDLGVRYVLEGSVQKAGERVRINAQLIDADSGHHLWADRMVRELKDLFALQDEIVSTIVRTLAVKVDDAERGRAMSKPASSLEAYDHVLQGREYCARTSRSANGEAQKIIRRAIELDPDYAPAYTALGWCYMDALRFGWTANPSKTLRKVHDLAQKALSIEDDNADAHRLLGFAYLKWKQYDLAKAQFERALELNPNNADTYDGLGAVTLYSGRTDSAIEAIETARRFNPNLGPSGLIHLGLAYYLKGRYDDAINLLKWTLGRNPDLATVHVVLAANFAKAGRTEDAARAAASVKRLHPFFDADSFGNVFQESGDRRKIREGLRKAGLK